MIIFNTNLAFYPWISPLLYKKRLLSRVLYVVARPSWCIQLLHLHYSLKTAVQNVHVPHHIKYYLFICSIFNNIKSVRIWKLIFVCDKQKVFRRAAFSSRCANCNFLFSNGVLIIVKVLLIWYYWPC